MQSVMENNAAPRENPFPCHPNNQPPTSHLDDTAVTILSLERRPAE